MTVKELIESLLHIPQHLEVELDITPEDVEEPVFVPIGAIIYDTQTVTIGE